MGRIKDLGLLGGTFNPPHLGHLILGESARQQLALARVLFLPAGQPPHKEEEAVIASRQRIEMTRLAIAGNEAFVLDTSDVSRPEPHHTVSLLPLIGERYPRTRLWLLLGGDSLRDFPTWHQPQQIIAQIRLAVLPRPGAAIDWATLEAAVPGIRAATTLLKGPALALSSTEIRARAAAGCSLRYLVPEPVRAYIKREHLYRTGD